MARDVYSLRIFATASLTPSSGVVGPVVPAGYVYVVRDIDVVLQTPSGANVMWIIAQTGGFLWYTAVDPAVNARWQGWRGRQVYAEGEQVGVQVQSGTWTVAISGYQLSLP